jgi:hypothetical protein
MAGFYSNELVTSLRKDPIGRKTESHARSLTEYLRFDFRRCTRDFSNLSNVTCASVPVELKLATLLLLMHRLGQIFRRSSLNKRSNVIAVIVFTRFAAVKFSARALVVAATVTAD